MKYVIVIAITAVLGISTMGCGASSAEDQRRAVVHQNNADQAARDGQYAMAGDEQRKAENAHAEAVQKAMDEGKPIPRQTRPGDPPPPAPMQ